MRLIGYWRSADEPHWPDPAAFVDEEWDTDERNLVASHLESQGRLFGGGVQAGLSPCRICGKPNGSAEFTDGFYLWPEGLTHYVVDHSVRLPHEFIDHVRRVDAEIVDRDWWQSAAPD